MDPKTYCPKILEYGCFHFSLELRVIVYVAPLLIQSTYIGEVDRQFTEECLVGE